MGEKPSYIDGILSTHFNECDIAAADAARTAHAFSFDDAGSGRAVQPIGRLFTDHTEVFRLIHLESTEVECEMFAGGLVEFVLAKDPRDSTRPLTLGAVVNGDAMLPIVTFEPRTDGRCSYVQLGQEIDEDKLVVTVGSSRTEQVEAVRNLLKGTSPTPDLVKKLVLDEAEQYRCEIESALPPTVCRLADNYYKDSEKTEFDLHIQEADSSLQRANATRILGVQLDTFTNEEDNTVNGHEISLVLGREVAPGKADEAVKTGIFGRRRVQRSAEEDRSGPLRVYACIRGNIAIQLAQFDTASGTVCLSGFDDIPSMEALQSFVSVLGVSNEANKALKDLEQAYIEAMQLANRSVYWLTRERKTSVRRTNRPGYYGRSSYDGIYELRLASSWDAFKHSNKSVGAGKKDGSQLISEALSSNYDEAVAEMIDSLSVAERLGVLVQDADTEHEKMVYRILGELANRGKPNAHIKGVLKGQKAGKTPTDVDTEVDLERAGNDLRVHITGRPVALVGFEPAVLFDETLSLVAKNKHIKRDKIMEIASVIGSLCTRE